MSEPIRSEPTPDTPPKKKSAWSGGCLGCLGGGGLGVAGLFVWIFFSQQLSMSRRAAAAVVIALVVAAAIASFRHFHRKDPSIAVGLLIGVAIAGLIAGMCASY